MLHPSSDGAPSCTAPRAGAARPPRARRCPAARRRRRRKNRPPRVPRPDRAGPSGARARCRVSERPARPSRSRWTPKSRSCPRRRRARMTRCTDGSRARSPAGRDTTPPPPPRARRNPTPPTPTRFASSRRPPTSGRPTPSADGRCSLASSTSEMRARRMSQVERGPLPREGARAEEAGARGARSRVVGAAREKAGALAKRRAAGGRRRVPCRVAHRPRRELGFKARRRKERRRAERRGPGEGAAPRRVTDDDEVQVPRSNVLEGSRALWEVPVYITSTGGSAHNISLCIILDVGKPKQKNRRARSESRVLHPFVPSSLHPFVPSSLSSLLTPSPPRRPRPGRAW